MGLPASQAETLGLSPRPGERLPRFAARIANAFGVVLLLVVLLYVLGSLMSYTGWSGVVLTAVASTCVIVALVSADARHRLIALGGTRSGVALVPTVIFSS